VEIFKNMHVFVEVAKGSSFRRAGDVLGMPSSTVSRRIAELEREVGLRLFHRTTRRVDLTEAGKTYFDNCQRIVQEAELAHLELASLHAKPSGLIRASMPVDFSVMYISRVLTEFGVMYPDIQFALDLNPGQSNLLTDGVDFAIRMGPPKDNHLIARQMATLKTGLYASAAYLSQHGTPEQPQDLLAHQCLRMRDAPWVLTRATDGHSESVRVHGRVTANNFGMLRNLALAGEGIMMNGEKMFQADSDNHLLVRVLPEWDMASVPVYVLTATRLLPAKVRVFIDFLIAKINDVEPTVGVQALR
jgi:DNA-binding transcriptional LysR family regulator